MGDIGTKKRTGVQPEPIPAPLFVPKPGQVPVELPVLVPMAPQREREKVPA